jgi:hypothetical protein
MTSQPGTLDAKPSHLARPRDAAHAVQVAAAGHGHNLSRAAAEALAKAATGSADGTESVTQAIPRDVWESGNREPLLNHMRHRLLDAVIVKGSVPVSLPKETVRYMRWDYGDLHDVPESAAWDTVQVTLSVGTRAGDVDRS